MEKKKIIKHPNEVVVLVNKKIVLFQDVIQCTILHISKNKMFDILIISDVTTCINLLNDLSLKIKETICNMNYITTDDLISELQIINNDLSTILKSYGTDQLEDILSICFGNNNNSIISSDIDINKFDLLKKYFHPTGYKVANIKKTEGGLQNEDVNINEKTKNLDCYDISANYKQFHIKVYGIKIFFYNSVLKKNVMIYGILDDVIIDFLNNEYINLKIHQILENKPQDPVFETEVFNCFISSLTLKDHLIFNYSDIYIKYVGIISNVNALKQNPLSVIIQNFIQTDLYSKRMILMQLLIKSVNIYDNQYLAYLLYDLLSNDVNNNVDTQEQTIIFDSFPWAIKKYFRDAMKRTIQYTNDLTNFDIGKIPLEQQICLLNANDNVKEKAMTKLKEIKAKPEDSGSKARQYLDGLLKIPFNIYKREPVLDYMSVIKNNFKDLIEKNSNVRKKMEIGDTIKDKYTSVEVVKYINKYKENSNVFNEDVDIVNIKKHLTTGDKNNLILNINKINELIKKHKLSLTKIAYSGKKKPELKAEIIKFIDKCKNVSPKFFDELKDKKYDLITSTGPENVKELSVITDSLVSIKNYISDVKVVLDEAIHGHEKAKKQLEIIICQWINGEQDGYCFGFEGPPGVGKTSLAKRGLSNCLKDAEGVCRPFAMIQMGGDSNGSTLHGHNYTYVGSTWGSIVQILIDKKCMNPIIFIDELDKISRTEHGKEIVGILTHLLDPTQNDLFQDKYFSGIDLDLSKALFVLSYNDVEVIDKILLDRIHRIKFSNLSLEDKLIISKLHIIPEVLKKMGLEGTINICEEVLKFIIEEYTSEPGVRKLKELLFEIIGEINFCIIKEINCEYNLPIEITIEDIKTKYLKDKYEAKHKKIHTSNRIGQINGMWANAMGQGGIIPIQVKYCPADKFLSLKLTGMQGDVMKESMNVSLTLAWELTNKTIKNKIHKEHFDILSGIHIHCPEGSVPKDGPSAGTAITTAIYSVFNNKKIRYNVAITGEITLDGQVTEIGCLDMKFLGGIKAGVTEFIYPSENAKDYNSFMEKYNDKEILNGIKFYPVREIQEVFEIIFDKE